ncbi:unannotated protein [freshwater metagenome]|uniref:Unannotated protein n=1 Tax=freshwater metagenome TaxID=449393 RepID=A0A6J7KRJ2_9ZZZZ
MEEPIGCPGCHASFGNTASLCPIRETSHGHPHGNQLEHSRHLDALERQHFAARGRLRSSYLPGGLCCRDRSQRPDHQIEEQQHHRPGHQHSSFASDGSNLVRYRTSVDLGHRGHRTSRHPACGKPQRTDLGRVGEAHEDRETGLRCLGDFAGGNAGGLAVQHPGDLPNDWQLPCQSFGARGLPCLGSWRAVPQLQKARAHQRPASARCFYHRGLCGFPILGKPE